MFPGDILFVSVDKPLWTTPLTDFMTGEPYIMQPGAQMLVLQSIPEDDELLVLANGFDRIRLCEST